VFAFQQEDLRETSLEIQEFRNLYQVDFSWLDQVMKDHVYQRVERYHGLGGPERTRMSEPVLAHTLDFRTLQDPVFFKPVTLTVLQTGHISGFCVYFRAWMDDEINLTNAPWAPRTHWGNLLCMLSTPKAVQAGEMISLELSYAGQLKLTLV
jgi:hypothetical protein